MISCPCGCGERFSTIGSRGRPRAYFSPACSLRVNHRRGGWDGRHHTAKSRALISEKASVPKPWIRGERNGMAGRTGSSNPNWKGGTSPERQRVYASSEWRRLRREVRRRDGELCLECGADDVLHLHHIKSWATHPELRLDPSNVVLLCRRCHYDKHRKGVRHQ